MTATGREELAQPVLSDCIEPEEAAAAAGLTYVSDGEKGVKRIPTDEGFQYLDPDGRPVTDAAALARFKALGIPPAWQDVWICARPDGHLQATGRDAKGRKQYRYHPRWREVRDETKYERTLAFAEALPDLRERVAGDMARPGLDRRKVVAAVVRLLEATHIRVGNEEYARDNKSFGLTTLLDRHVKVEGGRISFAFKGKSGVKHRVALGDRRLAKIVQRCRDLPGQQLFQYLDEQGNVQDVGSADVNAYLREVTGQPFTAKDFRTWAGTVWAASLLRVIPPAASEREAKQQLARAVEAVAERLGNTPTICRKCYIHPAVVDAHLDGALREQLGPPPPDDPGDGLAPDEVSVIAFLKARAGQ